MTKSDKVLVILFRYLLGIGSLFALVPVVMPWSWMAATHRWLGLGEMPSGPIVEYLARSLSGATCHGTSPTVTCQIRASSAVTFTATRSPLLKRPASWPQSMTNAAGRRASK